MIEVKNTVDVSFKVNKRDWILTGYIIFKDAPPSPPQKKKNHSASNHSFMDSTNFLWWLDLQKTLLTCLGSSPQCIGWYTILLEPCILFIDFNGSSEVLNDYLIPCHPSGLIKKIDQPHDGRKSHTKLLVFESITHVPQKHEDCLQTIIKNFEYLYTFFETMLKV